MTDRLKPALVVVASDRATRWGYRHILTKDSLSRYLKEASEKDDSPRAEKAALLRVVEQIERELICCDVYERDRGTWRAGRRHAACFWAGAARAIVLAEIDRTKT